jgi:hypothetical protein
VAYQNDTIFEVIENLFYDESINLTNMSKIRPGNPCKSDTRDIQNGMDELLYSDLHFKKMDQHKANFRENKKLISFEIPDSYVGLNYIILFNDFIQMPVPSIPIGLTTGRFCADSPNHHKTSSPRHYTSNFHTQYHFNPPNDITLSSSDENISVFSMEDFNYPNLPVTITNPLPTYVIQKGDCIISIGQCGEGQSSDTNKKFRNFIKKNTKKESIDINFMQNVMENNDYFDPLFLLDY